MTEPDWKDSNDKRGIVAEGDNGTVVACVHTKLDLSGDDTMPELSVTGEMQKEFRSATSSVHTSGWSSPKIRGHSKHQCRFCSGWFALRV